MPATRDGKLWRSQFYYKDWQGVRRKKNKRGFKTKGEADEWERNFLQQQQKNLDISFENFVEIYFADMENRLRESTIINKRYVFDLKVTPYFRHKKMCEIQTSDIRAWQNELIKKGYAPTYLKSINNQLAALFNYAVRYYDLRDNPCRKAGSIGKSKADEMDFLDKTRVQRVSAIYGKQAGSENGISDFILDRYENWRAACFNLRRYRFGKALYQD